MGPPGSGLGLQGYQGTRVSRVEVSGQVGPTAQMALLGAVCGRRGFKLIGDSRTPRRRLRPWNTATLTTGEFIAGFWEP